MSVFKDPYDRAAIMSALIGDIFDLTQTAYNCAAKMYALFALVAEDGVVATSKDFNDRLNYSAMIIDYGLAEVFGGILLATGTLQSASISLTSNGSINFKGEDMNIAGVKMNDVKTITPAVQQAIYTGEIWASLGEVGLTAIGTIFEIATTALKGKPTIKEKL